MSSEAQRVQDCLQNMADEVILLFVSVHRFPVPVAPVAYEEDSRVPQHSAGTRKYSGLNLCVSSWVLVCKPPCPASALMFHELGDNRMALEEL